MVRWGNHTHIHTYTRAQTPPLPLTGRSKWFNMRPTPTYRLTGFKTNANNNSASSSNWYRTISVTSCSITIDAVAVQSTHLKKKKLHSWKFSQMRKIFPETLVSYYTQCQFVFVVLTTIAWPNRYIETKYKHIQGHIHTLRTHSETETKMWHIN